MGTVTAKQLEHVFDDADWPMSKEDVVAHAEERGADEAVIGALRSLPLATYDRLEDVFSGIDTPDTPDSSH
jgi:hypothetical protein